MIKSRLHTYLTLALSLTFGLGFVACGSKEQQATESTAEKKPVVATPVFDADSAYAYVANQVSFGPRVPNSKAHDACASWMVGQMKQFADTVYEQKFQSRGFDGKVLNGKNIIAAFNPSRGNRIMLCAHWDTRPWADQDSLRKDEAIDGANDGASGVGVLMEVARQLSLAKPDLGVDIIYFDLEDYGQPDDSPLPKVEDSYCLGSQYWCKNLHTPNYFARYGILLDMVGASQATFTQEGTSMQYASDVVSHVWTIASNAGYGAYFLPDRTRGIIDDHYYINELAKIKVIDVVHHDFSSDSRFWKHWHTHGDTIDKIDRGTLKAVGQTLLSVLFTELNEN